jgi:formate dehydrogenase subunit delta
MSKTNEKLVYMANQIAAFFVSQGEEKGGLAVADHLRKYWDPHMRQSFQALAADGEVKLHPLARAAAHMLGEMP